MEYEIPTGCRSTFKDGCIWGRVSLAHVSTLGAQAISGRAPGPQSMAPTCDRVLNEDTWHCAWVFIDIEADGIVLLWNLDDEMGVPIH